MSEIFTCPACSQQFPYMPDLVGMKFDCPKCQHSFTVPLVRRTRSNISHPAPVPEGASASDPFADILSSSDTEFSNIGKDTQPSDFPALDPEPTPEPDRATSPSTDVPKNEETADPASAASPSDLEDAPIPSQPPDLENDPIAPAPPEPARIKPHHRARSKPRPVPLPAPAVKPAERNLRQATSLHVGLALIALGVFALPLPIGLPSLRHVGFVFCLAIMLFGSVICALALFRQHVKWIFGATACAMLALFLFANGGVDFSAGASSTLPADVINAAPIAARSPASEPATVPVRLLPGYETLVNRYEEKRVVRILILPPPNQRPDAELAVKAHQTFRPLAPSWSLIRRPDHLECALAPIEDLRALATTLSSLGTVSNIDDQSRTITFRF
jgi:hypothetical protein